MVAARPYPAKAALTDSATQMKPMMTAAEVMSSTKARMGNSVLDQVPGAAFPVLFPCMFSCFVPRVKPADSFVEKPLRFKVFALRSGPVQAGLSSPAQATTRPS